MSRENSTKVPKNRYSVASNGRNIQEIDESSKNLTKMTDGGTIYSKHRNAKKNSVRRMITRNNSVKASKRRNHIELLVMNPFEKK